MKKIAKQVNEHCMKLAAQNKLDGFTVADLNDMEEKKVAYLVDRVVGEMSLNDLNLPKEVVTAVVKTANQYVPAIATLYPQKKFAAFCEEALEKAIAEVNKPLQKAANQKLAETILNVGSENNPTGDANDPHTPFIEGTDTPTKDQMAEKPGVEGSEHFLKDMMNKNQASGAVNENETMRYSDDSVGSVDLNETFAMHDGTALAPGAMEEKLAHFKYIEAMDAIKKTADMIGSMFKQANEDMSKAEDVKAVKDTGATSAAADAVEKVEEASKKPEVDKKTVDKEVGLTDQAVAADLGEVLQTVPKKEEPKDPKEEQGMAAQKTASYDIDSLVKQCANLFSSK